MGFLDAEEDKEKARKAAPSRILVPAGSYSTSPVPKQHRWVRSFFSLW